MSTPAPRPHTVAPTPQGANLADVLERVLDKGLVVAGDIRVNLLDIELLTIRVRLLLASADKAQQLGMRWWANDPFFTGEDEGDGAAVARENEELRTRVAELERRLASLPAGESEGAGGDQTQTRAAAPAEERGDG